MKNLIFFLSITLTLSAFAQVPNYVPTNGLVGWWPFNGNANDASGNGYNGVVTGAILSTDRIGNANSAYNFNGSTNYITLSGTSTINFSQGATFAAWFNSNDIRLASIVDKEYGCVTYGYRLNIRNTGDIWAEHGCYGAAAPGAAGTFAPSAYSPNIWVHVVGALNPISGTNNLYINGSLINSASVSQMITNDKTIEVGRVYSPVTYEFFKGKIDDIGIWNRALTSCEIADLYNAQVGSLNTTSTTTVSNCENYTWNNQTYTQSGQYTFQTTNAAGCDSTATLNLTITQPTTGSETITECSSFTWNANNQTYTSSGQYSAALTNAAGCDSTVTLNLTITQPTTGSETITECNSFTWGANNQTYTQSGQYTAVLTNSAGCDSTATLNLTITQPSTGTETVSACDSYTWSANNQTYNQSGQYTAVLTNSAGCDSTATLNLSINTVDNGITQIDDISLQATANNAQYQWVDCSDNYQTISGETSQSFEATVNGSYAVIVTQNGCSDTTACITISKVGLENLNASLFTIYPNPAQTLITIQSEVSLNTKYTILDAQGRKVLRGKLEGLSVSVNIEHLANGLYTIQFEQAEFKEINFIKE